ncbi:hypothetical protein D039_0193A, partial [Vibrio parahaemolyticus EKP-028]
MSALEPNTVSEL